MESSGTGEVEDRIAALEKRLRGMDSLVKGLLDELLDFKAIAMTMSPQTGEFPPQELYQGSMVSGTTSPCFVSPGEDSAAARVNGVPRPDIPVAPGEPAMVRIMQADGTMKMEPRYGDKTSTDSTRGYRYARKGTAGRSIQNPLISAVE